MGGSGGCDGVLGGDDIRPESADPHLRLGTFL